MAKYHNLILYTRLQFKQLIYTNDWGALHKYVSAIAANPNINLEFLKAVYNGIRCLLSIPQPIFVPQSSPLSSIKYICPATINLCIKQEGVSFRIFLCSRAQIYAFIEVNSFAPKVECSMIDSTRDNSTATGDISNDYMVELKSGLKITLNHDSPVGGFESYRADLLRDYCDAIIYRDDWEVMMDLEQRLKTRVPNRLVWNNFRKEFITGFESSENRVVKLCLYITRASSNDFRRKRLNYFPTSIANLAALEGLYLIGHRYPILPECIGRLTCLKELLIDRCFFDTPPTSFGNFHSLQALYIANSKITALPECIGNLTGLTKLYLYHNALTRLPESLGQLQNLRYLYVGCNHLTTLPASIANFPRLKELYLFGNPWGPFPASIRKAFKTLQARGCNIFIEKVDDRFSPFSKPAKRFWTF